MKFALVGVGSGSTVRPEPLTEVAQTAERLDFESVWIPEHLVQEMTERAGRDFPRSEITVGLEPGLRPTRDAVQRFAEAGVHRLFVFAPGWTPRRKFQTDLYPQMETFAKGIIYLKIPPNRHSRGSGNPGDGYRPRIESGAGFSPV